MFCDAIRCYIENAKELNELTDEEKTVKWELTKKYSDDLVSKGGVSTDVFKKALGEESRSLEVNTGIPAVSGFKPSAEFGFAAGIAAFALTLRDSEYKGSASLDMAYDLIKPAEKPAGGVDPLGLRRSLLDLVSKAKGIKY